MLKGDTWQAVQDRHGVTPDTIKRWMSEYENRSGIVVSEHQGHSKAERYYGTLEDLLIETIGMLRKWAEACSDVEWVKKNALDAEKLGSTVVESADRFVGKVAAAPRSDDKRV